MEMKKGSGHSKEFRTCRDTKRKATAHLELNLPREIKDSKKGTFKYVKSKRKIVENVCLLLNEMGALALGKLRT